MEKIKNWFLYILITAGIYFRIQELGYSNLQGDEINPLDFLYGEKFWQYIFAQKRGPTQVLINWANTALFGYINEFQIRLPFLLFALFAFVTIYIFTKKILDKKTALWVLVLMSVNGLFIAFSRIAQYQAVVFFLLPLAGYLFWKYFNSKLNKYLYLSAIVYSLTILTHYDALTMLPFFLILPTMLVVRGRLDCKKTIKDLAVFFIIVIIPNAIFYTFLVLNPYFKEVASGYLYKRLFEGGFMPRTASNMPILSLYVPKHYLLFLFSFLTLGLGFLRQKFGNYNFRRIYTFFVVLLFSSTIFSLYPIKPRLASLLVITSSVVIVGLLALRSKAKSAVVGVVGWILFAFCTYYFVMKDPRTHVYTTFLPGFVLAAYGIKKFLEIIRSKALKHLAFVLFGIFFALQLGILHQMFVDKSPEYPWWDKEYLGKVIYHINSARHKKVEGVFGISYYRGWERIADAYDRGCLKGSFWSNEKDSISYFYTRTHQTELDYMAENLVIVEGPHSWVEGHAGEFRGGYEVIKILKSKGVPVSFIYAKQGMYPNKQPYCDF